jgi:hypothetical protein
VVTSLVSTGIRYVAVDDYHFLCAGEDQESLDSFFSTDEDGRRLDLFPISEAARYRLPFSPAGETVAWLEDLARQGRRAAIYFDDIEKFGIWPETYEWVFEKGWLTQFVEGVLASKLIRTETYADYHAREKTRGIVYLPTTSYIEMNEWTLPAPRAATYHALLEQEKAAGRFEAHKPFLRGGIWRNFMSRYTEANWMHKRMLGASRRLAALPPEQRTAELQEYLHRAQANDAYWHGLFGGLYLPHLRRAIWNNLLKLEAALEQLAPWPRQQQGDLDHDGHIETALRNPFLHAYVRDDGHASLVEFPAWSWRTISATRCAPTPRPTTPRSTRPPQRFPRRLKASPRPTTALPSCMPSSPRTRHPTHGRAGSSWNDWVPPRTHWRMWTAIGPATNPAPGLRAARAGAFARPISSRRTP